MNCIFDVRGVCVRFGPRTVLNDVRLAFGAGELIAVLGPNGAGKTTLLNVMSGLLRASSGECVFQGKPIERWTRRALATQLAYVQQQIDLQFPFSAEQVVRMGRTAHIDRLFDSPEDDAAVVDAMRLTESAEWGPRDFRTLSGGEKQRVVLASALAQTRGVLLLDEPTAFLDLRHQRDLYRLLRDICGQGTLAIAVTHDLNLAATYANRVVLLRDGCVAADGHPNEVLSAEVVQSVFGVDAVVGEAPNGRPHVFYAD